MCRLDGAADYESAVTIRDGIVTVTMMNTNLDSSQEFAMNLCGEPVCAKVLFSDSVLPYSHFSEGDLEIAVEGGELKTVLPPHSVAKICMKMSNQNTEGSL